MKLILSAALLSFNAGIIGYFVAMVGREVIRAQLGLEKISRTQLQKFLEERAWGTVGHKEGAWPTFVKAVLLHLVWRLEVSTRRRWFPKERTRARLVASFEHNTLVANARERQRRALKIATWIVHGAVTDLETCERVVKYEARHRPASQLFGLCADRSKYYKELLALFRATPEEIRAEARRPLAFPPCCASGSEVLVDRGKKRR